MTHRDRAGSGRASGAAGSEADGVAASPDRGDAHGRRRASALDTLFRSGSARLRYTMILGTAVALLTLAGISVAIALHEYSGAKHAALVDLQARVDLVGALVDEAFGADIGLLDAAAQTPSVTDLRLPAMDAYFHRVAAGSDASFSDGIAWIDRAGHVRAASSSALLRAGVDAAGRTYFRRVLATGAPYVSSGIVGRLTKSPLIVVAVATRAPDGRITGVLTGRILLHSVGESARALALGFGNLEVIDRDGRMLLANLAAAPNRALIGRIRRLGSSGVIADSAGLSGHGSDAVAFSVSALPDWIVVIDRSRSALFASATHALELALSSVAAALVIVLTILGLIASRVLRQRRNENARARAWSGLTRTLARASSPPEVTNALLGALTAAFPRELAVVALGADDDRRVVWDARRAHAREIGRDAQTRSELASLGSAGAQSVPVGHIAALRRPGARVERRFRSLHALPIVGRSGRAVGTIALLSPTVELDASDWALLTLFADQTAVVLERAERFEHEHALAVRLQRSLLPDRLPTVEAVTLAGHYHAGGLGVEVGGDWYDAVRRPDGIIHVCIGDVSGRGIDAATVMGRQRNVFRAYAYECASPAEILRRMLRHVEGDEMVTVACVSIDLYTAEVSYSCAGHPPPLLIEHATGTPRWLDGHGAPPIGVARPHDIDEGQLQLRGAATFALYTDGLVERRGASIDEGITLLGTILARDLDASPDSVLARVSEVIGAPDDDIALVLVTVDPLRASFEVEISAEPSAAAAIRGRLRSWLGLHGIGEEESQDIVLAVSEACNNAIEHAYPGGAGTISVQIGLDGRTLRAVVEDSGDWRAPVPSEERGLGLILMRALMESVEIEYGKTGTRVRLERSVTVAVENLLPASSLSEAPG